MARREVLRRLHVPAAIAALLAAAPTIVVAQQAAAKAAPKVDPAAIRRACEACARLSVRAEEDVRETVAPLATVAVRCDARLLEPLIAELESGGVLDESRCALLAAAGPAVRPYVARIAALGSGQDPAALARVVLALRAIAPFGRDPKAVALLVRGLDHKDEEVARAAREALLEIAPEEPALRRHFFERLVAKGEELGPAEVDALIKTGLDADLARFVVARLAGDSRGESFAAAEVVRRVALRSAAVLVPALLAELRAAPPETRAALVAAFAPLGRAAGAAAPDLARLIADESPDVRAAALRSLAAIAPASEELAGAAIHGLRDPDDGVRAAAGVAFAEVAPEHVAPFLASPAARGDVALRAELVGLLAQQLGSEPGLADDAPADADARRKRDEAGAIEGRRLDVLLAAASDPAADVRVAAIGRLSAANGPPARVLDALGAALGDREPSVRAAAAAAVHELGELALPLLDALTRSLDDGDHEALLAKSEALAALFEALPAAEIAAAAPASGADLSVAELSAAAAQARAAGSPDLPPLTAVSARRLFDAIARPADPDHAAALELSREEFDHFDLAAEQVVIDALSSESVDVRRAAANWLDSDSPDPKAATQALLKRLGEPDDEVAAALIDSIATFRPAPLAGIEESLRSPDAHVRRRALAAVAAVGIEARPLAPRLIALLGDQDAGVRNEACRAFFVVVVQRYAVTRD
jgi:HEAT repeat protein